MDLFPKDAFVRLRSRARGKYVHADEDAVGVSLRPLGAAPSLNAVWRADYWTNDDGAFLLLQGAAYGRCLAASAREAPPGHRGVRAVQSDYNSPNLEETFVWTADRVEAGQDYVCLSSNQRGLRANGRYRHRNNVVTLDSRDGKHTTMMQWTVEVIPLSPAPVPLPLPPPPPIHVRRGLFRRRAEPEVHVHPLRGRRIRHQRVDDDGNYEQDHKLWPGFDFYGNSVFNLRGEVARHLDEDVGNITLCVRAGLHAIPIPLITDLPNNVDPMDIVVLTNGSPAAAALEYPQFDVPEP